MRPGTLSSRRDFERVLGTGTRARRDGVTAAVVAADRPRLGLVVRASSAVRRNRTKRRLRSAFRVSSVKHSEVVLSADRSVESLSFQELAKQVLGALEAAGAR